ncbi:hypothetical protein [Spirobacillus cienkowskii]|uniref:hypothetical protein n=1 Tax=Spirobacillus cienkowskii TaxID=495820 RepID=UPI0030CD1DD5
MPQYPFIFIGSILAILSINIGCKAPDSSSKNNTKGKKIQEENNQKEEPKLRVGYTLYNVPTIVAAGSDSGFFYGFDTPAKTDSQVKNLQNFEKNIQISITKDGEDSDLKIKAVEKTNPILFYFNVPKSTPLGNYNVILNSNKFPNIKKSYSFKVVDEKKLDPTTIKSIQIKSLQQFRLNHNFNIPKGKCIDLLVTAETSTDQIVYNITNENWLIKNINSQVTNFTLTEDMKICAYYEKYGSKYLPKAGDETQFKISHAGKDFIAKFIATENLEKASGQEDTASKSSDPEWPIALKSATPIAIKGTIAIAC